jgi:hypothetical protein
VRRHFSGHPEPERARRFYQVTATTMAVAIVCLIGIAVVQRDLLEWAMMALISVLALGVTLSAVSRRGHARVASALLVVGLVRSSR